MTSSSYRNPGSSQTINYTIDSDPSVVGLAAEAGALCARLDDPSIYCHTGPLDTDWTRMGIGGGGSSGSLLKDFSVNNARAYPIDSIAVLATGGSANPAGAFNGGGTGNKSILGYPVGLVGISMTSLVSVEYTWRNILGLGGNFFNPPTAAAATVPYLNFIVDFGAGDLRVLTACDGGLNPAVSAAIGSYANPGGLNTLTYSWDNTKAVCIVGAPPAAVPGGVVPIVSVGPGFLENAYSWAALAAANPAAVILDTFPANAVLFPNGDGGMPAGQLISGIVLVSGDSGNVTKTGKRILSWKINGVEVLA